ILLDQQIPGVCGAIPPKLKALEFRLWAKRGRIDKADIQWHFDRHFLEWDLGQEYLRLRGNKAFISDASPVPFVINNDGTLSRHAAEVFVTSLLEAEKIGALPEQLHVLELGIGVGLFARFFLDHVQDLCRQLKKDYYQRLTYIAADRSQRMLSDLLRHGILANHPGRFRVRQVDAMQPEQVLSSEVALQSLTENAPPHPQPLSPEYRGEGSRETSSNSRKSQPLRAVFLNYLLDCLPCSVLKFDGGQATQLYVRTCVARNIKLADYTDLTAEQLRQRAASSDPRARAELLEVYGLFASEYDYRPVELRDLPYGDFAAEYGRRSKNLLHSYGAIQSLERLLDLVADDGFILVNDYGPMSNYASPRQMVEGGKDLRWINLRGCATSGSRRSREAVLSRTASAGGIALFPGKCADSAGMWRCGCRDDKHVRSRARLKIVAWDLNLNASQGAPSLAWRRRMESLPFDAKDVCMVWPAVGGVVATGLVLAGAGVAWQIRRRHMQRWLPAYLANRSRYLPVTPDEDVHLLLCLCDHYEPRAGNASIERGRQRVAVWSERYPAQFGRFRDSDGRTPRYSYFYPIEDYQAEYIDALAKLCRQGFGEVEVHLHHDRDTPENLRARLLEACDIFFRQHGLLSRHRETGKIGYAFIHGNWALCNARPDGWHCGVDHEIPILLETGCFADLTYPSAPSATQPPLINRIYWAGDRAGGRRSQDVETADPTNALLMIQGPLLLDWRRRKWGIIPHVENACLQTTQPPSIDRLHHWLRARVQVPGRPDWFFVKLHAHGAPEHDHEALLGTPMVRFHEELAERARANPKFHYHYVTAREMANLARAAFAGYQGDVAGALDWEMVSLLG
ncbi:MAG TPA: hypothetical protein VFE62_18095, partial [Gemmataceae bacterium]|nr:hypothetical protein [Gemmataceae bacterium]